MCLTPWIQSKYLLVKSCHSDYSVVSWPIKFEKMAIEKYKTTKYNFRDGF